VAAPRRLVLVVLALAVLLTVAVGAYLRHHANETEKAAATCDTPAPPPKPVTPPPKLPGFAIEASCGPGEAKPAPAKK
jgi:hypothetical protein